MTRSLPDRFVARVEALLPKSEQADFLARCTEPLPKTIRSQTTDLPVNWELGKVALIDEAFFIDRTDKSKPLGKTSPHMAGQIYSATLSSLLAAKVMSPYEGDKVLDLCSAPGSKTTFLASLVGAEGAVIANELSSSRTKKLAANIDRMGCANTVICQNDGATMQYFCDQEFDSILLDAPCSSEGFGRKSSEFFNTQWSEKKIYECSKLQKKLIVSAFNMLRPEGDMLYSTCTSAPEENEAVVDWFLNQFPEAELIPVDLGDIPHGTGIDSWEGVNFDPQISKHARRLWPHKFSKNWDSELFFLAKIRKKHPLKRAPAVKNFQDSGLNKLPKNKMAEITTQLFKYWGIPKDVWRGKILVESKGDIFVTNNLAYGFAKKNKYQRVGLKILDKHFNITHPFVLHFGKHAVQNVIDLSSEEMDRFLGGYDFEHDFVLTEIKSPFKGMALVRCDGYTLGWAKQKAPGKWKNKLDRSVVF